MLPNLKDLMKKAKEMQEQMKKAQAQIASVVVTGEAGGGLIKMQMNGGHEVLRVEVAPELLKEDTDMLEDLIAAACNDAVQKVKQTAKDQMQSITKNMQLPDDLLDKIGG